MKTVHVRPLNSGDRVKLWQFTTACGEDTQLLFRPIPAFYSLEGVKWYMDVLDNAKRFVAENSLQEIVGIAYYIMNSENQATFGICVCDNWQRRGIGNLLMETMEKDAREHGFEIFATGGGTQDDGRLRGLLKKRGYRNLGLFSLSSLHQIMMEKQL